MNAERKLRAFQVVATGCLLIALALGVSFQAQAFCSSCAAGAPAYSVGYAAPATYSAAYAPTYSTAYYAPSTAYYAPSTAYYAPTYTTAYNSGWYPGRFLGRVNRAVWGYPTTTYYAPVAFTAAYAPTYTTAYAAPACSTCSASYAAPTCSTCTASYAPACSSCSAGGVATVSESYAIATPGCATCSAGTVEQAGYTETVAPPPATSTYNTTTTPPSTTTEPQPEIDPGLNLPAERSELKTQKPAVTEPATQPAPQPGPGATDDDSATNLQAPQLFDPNDHTAAKHRAPVWTAVYHKVGNADRAVQPISYQTNSQQAVTPAQVERDAEGWTSASK